MTATLRGTKSDEIRLSTMTHASWSPFLSRSVQVALFGGAAAFMLAVQSPAQAASPSAEIKEMFSKMDRQLCRSLSLATCKRLIAKKKSKSKPGKRTAAVKSQSRKAEATKVKPNSDNIANDKSTTAPVPLPVLKQAKREVVSVSPPPENVKIPMPTLKPATLTKQATISTVPTPVEKKAATQKLPEIEIAILPTPIQLPPSKPPVHAMPDGTLVGEACFDSLKKLGVTFSQPVATVGAGLCAVSDAVQVQSITIGSAVINLSDQPTFNCGFAFKFASWMKVDASPIVTKTTGKTIATFGTGPGFQCRGRNGDMTAKLSEHAFGNAVDIERIKLSDGEVIDVKDAMTVGSKYQSTLAALRSTACQYFTTVLGPGTNAAHATHFHFDAARRGKKGNHTMCQ